jgi:hypothetical protein
LPTLRLKGSNNGAKTNSDCQGQGSFQLLFPGPKDLDLTHATKSMISVGFLSDIVFDFRVAVTTVNVGVLFNHIEAYS